MEEGRDYYRIKSVSNSGINHFEKSPLSYKKNVLERDAEAEECRDLYKGRLLHQYILEPDTIEVMDIEAPSDTMCKLVEIYDNLLYEDENTAEEEKLAALEVAHEQVGFKNSIKATLTKFNDKKAQDYLEFIRKNKDPKNIVVDRAMKNTLEMCNEAVYEDKGISEFLSKVGNDNVHIEMPILWSKEIDDYKTGGKVDISLKSKLDYIEVNPDRKEIIHLDLKSTSSSIFTNNISIIDIADIHSSRTRAYGFNHSIIKYRYYRQLAFYTEALKFKYSKEWDCSADEITVVNYIAAVNTTQKEAGLFSIPDLLLNIGKEEYERLLPELYWHLRTGIWDKNRKYEEEGLINLEKICLGK